MSQDRREGPFEKMGEAVGGAVGKAAGRANDMAMNAVGTVFGQAMQTLGAWWSTPDAEQASRSFGETQDHACRRHWEGRGGAGGARDYESARPAYQFGYVAARNPEYQSRPFDQVEAEVERAWEKVRREQYGDWNEVRDQVSYGYTYREPGAPNPT
ncbi:MAG TPA: hypothetical protein VHG51_02055 [Longimicrobiaceae bacterium]|nr:hypothetical protein [Longimicrobiaceae bacterium]